MLELILIGVFALLFGKALGLVLKLTWGAAKLVVGLVMGLAVPVLVVSVLFAGGLALLVPVAMVGLVFFLLKAVF